MKTLVTIGCEAGRHGTETRTLKMEFIWDEAPCLGYVKSMDGYLYECACECHGAFNPSLKTPWLAQFMTPFADGTLPADINLAAPEA